MISLLKKNRTLFALSMLAAAAMRVVFIVERKMIDGDSFIYGEIAANWLTDGIFGLWTDYGIKPTYIRLPGYPAFMAAVWRFTGVDHYKAIMAVQLLFDIGTCLIVADLARRIVSARAAKLALLLAAFCPFVAIYVAAPLTETLAIFFAALALDLAVVACDDLGTGRLRYWVACGSAVGAGILLRPDGGILLGSIGLFLLLRILRTNSSASAPAGIRTNTRIRMAVGGLVLASVALAPLVPWSIRNWRDFHRFQPLAPRYANAPEEPANHGFQRWVRTWMVDYTSVVEIYWMFPGEKVDLKLLPARAFDSEQERQETAKLFDEYNNATFHWSPSLDAELAQIADARVKRHPVRYYVLLPALRIADMWMRPRTDLMRTNDRWWEYREDPRGTIVGVTMGLINLVLVGAAVYAALRRRNIRYIGLLLLFVLVRSLFLGSLENPETRYTLECYPVVFTLAAAAFAGRTPETSDVVAEELAHTRAQV